MKSGVAPGSLVMPVSGVKYSSLSGFPGPGPWLSFPCLQDVTVIGALMVDVGFIPGLKSLEAPHDRVRRLLNFRGESAGSVGFKLGADQLDILHGVKEAV